MKRRNDDAGAIRAAILADLPDELLRYPPFIPTGGASRYRPWKAALDGWLAGHGVDPTLAELEAERRRRWPVVDRIVHPPEASLGAV